MLLDVELLMNNEFIDADNTIASRDARMEYSVIWLSSFRMACTICCPLTYIIVINTRTSEGFLVGPVICEVLEDAT